MEIVKFRSQLSVALEQMTAHLRQGALTLLERGLAGVEKLEAALAVGKIRLRWLFALSYDAAVSTEAKVARQMSVGLDHVVTHLRQAQNTAARLGTRVADKPRRLHEGLRAKENDLRKLLAISPDAIVVTDADRRFVDANPKALDLFGVSRANMKNFTVDIFLSCSRTAEFNGNVNVSPFRKRNAKVGKCEIRRLDGSLRVAEYQFFANFVPFRHVYKFHNARATNQFLPPTLRTTVNPSRLPRQIAT